MNKDFYYKDENDVNNVNVIPNSLKTGFATASFIISIINLIFCASMLSFITVPVSIILSIVSLATHRGGKVFAIFGIIISVISAFLFGAFLYVFMKISPDIMYFQENSTEIISEYETDGTIPEQFEKYRSPDYDKYWEAMGCNDFDGFFKMWIDSYKQAYGYTSPSVPDNSESPSSVPETPKNNRDREELVDLNYIGAISGIKFLKTA